MSTKLNKVFSAFLVAILIATTIFQGGHAAGTTTLVSVSSSGVQPLGNSSFPAISADGRYIAFESISALVETDVNTILDVYLRDSINKTTTRVSVASDGTEGNNSSFRPTISADGRYIAFSSYASNLVPNDTNGMIDIFIHDMQTGITKLVSVSSSGMQGNGNSEYPAISADGQFVAFMSDANNFVIGDTNSSYDVFVRNMQSDSTLRASVGSDGAQGSTPSVYPGISADGRYVVFDTYFPFVADDTNFSVDVFIRDMINGITSQVSLASDGAGGNNRRYRN